MENEAKLYRNIFLILFKKKNFLKNTPWLFLPPILKEASRFFFCCQRFSCRQDGPAWTFGAWNARKASDDVFCSAKFIVFSISEDAASKHPKLTGRHPCVLTETLSWRSSHTFDLCLCSLFKVQEYLFLKILTVLTCNSRLVGRHSVELQIAPHRNNTYEEPLVFALFIKVISSRYQDCKFHPAIKDGILNSKVELASPHVPDDFSWSNLAAGSPEGSGEGGWRHVAQCSQPPAKNWQFPHAAHEHVSSVSWDENTVVGEGGANTLLGAWSLSRGEGPIRRQEHLWHH